MRALSHRLLAAALAAGPALTVSPAPTAAQPGDGAAAPAEPPKRALSAQEQAAVFFEKGRDFFKQKRYREAAEQFQAAYNLDPVPILLYNLARAAEEMGDPERAIGHYQSYLKRVGPEAEDRGEVERRIRVMEKTIAAARRARVRIVGLPPQAKILVDGQPAELEDGLVRAEPGRRELRVVPEAGPPWVKQLGLDTGEYVEVVYGEVEAPPPEPGMSATAIAGWSAAGGGLVLAALGGVFYAEASAASDEWQDAVDALRETSDEQAQAPLVVAKADAADRAESNEVAAYVLWGLGGAALAAGATLLALEYGAGDGPTTEAAVVPLPGGVGLIGRF